MTEETKPETRTQRENREILEKIDALNELRGAEIVDVTAYIYRQARGRARVSLPKLHEILDDNDLGEIYGPGEYHVVYTWRDSDGNAQSKPVRYNLGPEFIEPHLLYCQQTGRRPSISFDGPGGSAQAVSQGVSLAEMLTKEKAESLAVIVSMLKGIFGGGDGNEALKTQAETFRTILGSLVQQQRPALPEALVSTVLTKAIEGPRESPIDSIGKTLELFSAVREFAGVAPQQEREQDGGKMDKLLEMGLNMLPGLVEKFGSVAAAASAQKSNPLIRAKMRDPDVQKQFYAGMVHKYGKEYADQWAREMGVISAPAPQRSAPVDSGVIRL